MSKKLMSILISVFLYLSMCSIGTVSADVSELPEKPEDTNRYYFYMPDEWLNKSTHETGDTAGIYWWEGTDAHNLWPGVPAKKADAEGVYYYDVSKDVSTIIWNNYVDGGFGKDSPKFYDSLQTNNLGTEFYDPGESDLYPDGFESFDGMIFVVDYGYFLYGDFTAKATYDGEWFYYYGNGEYGTAPKRGDSRVLSGSTVNIDDVLESNNAGDEWASPSEFVAYYIGDANGDHRVNIKDATHIQKAIAGLVELDWVEMIAAEVDRTDMITIKDATTIQKWLARMDTGTYNDDFIGRFWVC